MWNILLTFLEPFELTKFFEFGKPIEKIKPVSLLFAYRSSPKHIKILNLGLNFVSDLAQVEEARYIASCNIFKSK